MPPVLSLVLTGLLTMHVGNVWAVAPLSDRESTRADTLARQLPPQRARTRSDLPAHALGLQSVVIEPEFRKGVSTRGAPAVDRRARVYQYDHVAQRARLVRVDLATDAVLDSSPIEGHHLPLSAAEQRWALGRLAARPRLIARLQAEQMRRGHRPFARLDELDVKASIFEPVDDRHACARERCALLSLFDATRTVFATEPLVRFATGDVTTLDAMAVDGDAH